PLRGVENAAEVYRNPDTISRTNLRPDQYFPFSPRLDAPENDVFCPEKDQVHTTGPVTTSPHPSTPDSYRDTSSHPHITTSPHLPHRYRHLHTIKCPRYPVRPLAEDTVDFSLHTVGNFRGNVLQLPVTADDK